jgi:hypothetical protein
MNILTLPTFDRSLADSEKLAAVARTVKLAMDYAEGALQRADAIEGDLSSAALWARRSGLLEASMEVMCSYLGQIAGQVKPDDLLPFTDDLGEAS